MIDFLDEDERADWEMKERFKLKLENVCNEQLEELDKKIGKKGGGDGKLELCGIYGKRAAKRQRYKGTMG